MWSVSTIIAGVISFMVETSPVHFNFETTLEQKRQFSSYSLEFNTRDATFCKLFPELVEIHKKRMEERIRAMGPKAAEVMNQEMAQLSSIDGGALKEMQRLRLMVRATVLLVLLSILFIERFLKKKSIFF